MANIELKFIDCTYACRDFVKVKAIGNIIKIESEEEGLKTFIRLDKSTAIKFAKTLRTEINKIQ